MDEGKATDIVYNHEGIATALDDVVNAVARGYKIDLDKIGQVLQLAVDSQLAVE